MFENEIVFTFITSLYVDLKGKSVFDKMLCSWQKTV